MLPVNEIAAVFASIKYDATSELPRTTLRVPGGTPVESKTSSSWSPDCGVTLEGLKTAVFPTIKDGAAKRTHCHSGKFQGIIDPITPSGSKAT